MDSQNLNWRNEFPEGQRDYIIKNWRAALEKLPGMNIASLDNIVLQTEKGIYETASSIEEYRTRCLAKIEEVKNSFGQNPQQLAHNNNLQFMGMGQVPMMNQQLGFNPQHQQIPPHLANLNPALVQQLNPALLQANPNLNMLTQFQRANLLKQQSIANPNFQALQQLKLHQQQQQQLQNLQAAQAQQQAQKLQDQIPTMQHMPGQNMVGGIAQPQQTIVRPTTAQVANATQIPSTLNLNTAAAKSTVVPANSQNPAGVFNYPNQFVANGAAGAGPFGNMNFQALLAANPQLKQNINPTQLAQLASVQNLGKQINPAHYQMLLQAQAAQNQVHAQSQALSMAQNQVPRPLSQQMPTANLQQNQPTAITQPNLVPPGSAHAQINPNSFMSPAMAPQKLANQQPQPNPAQSPAAKPANSTPVAPVAEQPPVQASPAQSPHVVSTPSNAQTEKTDTEIVKIINQLSEQVKSSTKAPQPIPNLSAQDQLKIRQELEKIAKVFIQIDRLIFFTCKFTNESATLRLIKIKGLIQSQMAVASEGKFGLTAEMISKLNQDLMRQHTRIENSIKGPNSAKLGPVSMAQTASTNSQTTPATTPTMVSNTLSSEITPLPLPPTNVTPSMPQRTLPPAVSQATTVESAPQSAAPVTNINQTPQTTTMVNPTVNPLQNSLMMNFGNPVQPPGMNQMGMMPQNLTNAAAMSMMANMAQQAQNPVRPQPVRTTRPGRPPRKQSQQLTPQALVRPPAGNIQQPQFPHFTIPSQQVMMAGNRPMQVPLNTMNQFLYNQGMMRPAGVYPQMTVGMSAGVTAGMTASMPVQVTQPVTNPTMPVQVKQEPVTVKIETQNSELQKSVTEESVQQVAQKSSQDSKLEVKAATTEASATSNSPLPEAFKSAVDHMKLNITNLQIPPNVKRKLFPQHLAAQTIATNSTTSPSSAHPSNNPTNPFARALSTTSSKDQSSSAVPEDVQPKRIKLELPERDTSNPLAYTTKALELLKHRNNFDKYSKLEGAESVLNNIPKSTKKSINEVFGVVINFIYLLI